MAVPRAHAEQVAKIVGELVPLAEAIFPVLRRPLALELKSKLAAIEPRLTVDALKVLRFYGLPIEDGERASLLGLADRAKARSVAAFQGLINALEGDRPMTIAAFVQVLMVDLVAAIDLHQRVKGKAAEYRASGGAPEVEAIAAKLGVTIPELEQMFAGDSAFSALMAFLEHTRSVLRTFGPRSILEQRSGG
jgi:hypothetical protein